MDHGYKCNKYDVNVRQWKRIKVSTLPHKILNLLNQLPCTWSSLLRICTLYIAWQKVRLDNLSSLETLQGHDREKFVLKCMNHIASQYILQWATAQSVDVVFTSMFTSTLKVNKASQHLYATHSLTLHWNCTFRFISKLCVYIYTYTIFKIHCGSSTVLGFLVIEFCGSVPWQFQVALQLRLLRKFQVQALRSFALVSVPTTWPGRYEMKQACISLLRFGKQHAHLRTKTGFCVESFCKKDVRLSVFPSQQDPTWVPATSQPKQLRKTLTSECAISSS